MSMPIVAAVTFGVFMTEALVHYNTGIAASNGTQFKFTIPAGDELVKLGAIVGVATFISTKLIDRLEGR
jgi:hypothetical protein